ncbi:MAG: hypothetical protein ABSG15_05475 [FCB group bacterium]|jgi:hypothetical protein
MIASIFQLAGAILLGLMVAVRQGNEINKYVTIIPNVRGKVNPRILEIYKETYLFRIGLFYIIIGYSLQIAELKLDCISTLKYPIRIIAAFVIVIVFCFVGKHISNIIAKKKFKKEKPFDPDVGTHIIGEIMLEEK